MRSLSVHLQRLHRSATAFVPIRTRPLLPQYDYIVVGAGSAGCVVASRLSEDPNVRVLLLEAGRQDNHPFIHIPVLYFKSIGDARFDWKYKVEADSSGLSGRSIVWPRGRILGGSSCLNGLLYVRGQPADYDEWAKENPGWAWKDVLPLFRRSEDNESYGSTDFESELHGIDGPQSVSNGRLQSDIAEKFMDAASEALGIPRLVDMNGAQTEGIGYFQQITQVVGIWPLRCSSAVGYLHSVRRARPNLHIRCNTEVEELELQEDSSGLRAAGVNFTSSGQRTLAELAPGGEVVLAAGALGSPHLLMRSGIGEPEALHRAGVRVHQPLPGVGQNLQDHLQIRPKFAVGAPTLNTQTRGVLQTVRVGLDYALRGRGPASMAASQVCAFFRSAPEAERPDLQFHFQPLSTSGSPAVHLDEVDAITASVCQLRPRSRGHLELRNDGSLAIHANYLSHEEDCQVVAAGIRAARRCAEQLGQQVNVHELAPGPAVESEEALVSWARETAETIYHPSGTCKMGPVSDSAAVVDHRLRVHGVAGLRVADCAIMPTLVSGNTHAPTVVIGEKCADMLREERTHS